MDSSLDRVTILKAEIFDLQVKMASLKQDLQKKLEELNEETKKEQ